MKLLLLPIIYAIIVFCVLLIAIVYIVGQIRLNQRVETKLNYLTRKIKSANISYDDCYRLGQIYLQKKIYNKAIILFRKALEDWDANDKIGLGSLYNTIGFTYFTLKKYYYAIYYYEKSINLLPDYILALSNLGLAYEKVKLYKNSISIYEQIQVYDKKNELAKERISYLQRFL